MTLILNPDTIIFCGFITQAGGPGDPPVEGGDLCVVALW